MITKERLEELIEQCATVYMARAYTEGIYLMPENFEVNDKELVFKYKLYVVPLEDLFETEEDAKWFAEFGCIERTERLELPTWEEISKDLKNVPAGNYVIKEFDDVSLEYIKYRNGNYAVIGVYKYDDRLELEATKENYTLACRKAKELFLGENK